MMKTRLEYLNDLYTVRKLNSELQLRIENFCLAFFPQFSASFAARIRLYGDGDDDNIIDGGEDNNKGAKRNYKRVNSF